MIGIRVNSRLGGLKRYAANLQKELAKAVDQGGAYTRDHARSIAPVKSGAYRASIHYVSARRSGFEVAAQAAVRHAAFGGQRQLTIGTASGSRRHIASLFPRGRGEVFFGGSAPKPKNPYDVYIFAAVGYAIFIEYGTRYMPGRFVLTRASHECRAICKQLIMDAVKRSAHGILQ